MSDKREWYTAELWTRDQWKPFMGNNGTLEVAQEITKSTAERCPDNKTRIVRHTTEIVEEREARG